ncbi:MAG: Type 1 glutamine amidotransferase-like domain-containing protein [Candidatus Pacebacteria bacterium]|nr:Type 1 glutamine amidotransferase-like domain-containing protein [Candidatus Paceibacterota bacterium]
MKTKFILHGGFTFGEEQGNDEFTKEILKDAPEKAEILLVYFAKEKDRIPKNKEEDINQFNKNKGDKGLSFKVATEESFEDQIKEADIIYLHGGLSPKILEIMKRFPNLQKLFEGKIIAGDSAGANVLTKVFYSFLSDKVFEGLGLLPIKLIPHYEDKFKNKLDDMYPELETVRLSEYKFVVYEQ